MWEEALGKADPSSEVAAEDVLLVPKVLSAFLPLTALTSEPANPPHRICWHPSLGLRPVAFLRREVHNVKTLFLGIGLEIQKSVLFLISFCPPYLSGVFPFIFGWCKEGPFPEGPPVVADVGQAL